MSLVTPDSGLQEVERWFIAPEIRVGVACKLLLENRISIKQVCYESGFHNFASFHKYFKMITNKTPLNYQREYLNNSN